MNELDADEAEAVLETHYLNSVIRKIQMQVCAFKHRNKLAWPNATLPDAV